MLLGGGEDLVLWVVLAAVLVPAFAWLGWRRQGRFGAVSAGGFAGLYLAVLALVPFPLSLAALVLVLVGYLIAGTRHAMLRNIRADLELVDPRDAVTRPDAAVLVQQLEDLGCTSALASVVRSGSITWHRHALIDGTGRVVVEVAWIEQAAVPKAAISIASKLAGGGAVATSTMFAVATPPGVFAQAFRDRGPSALLRSHERALLFVRQHGFDIEPVDLSALPGRLVDARRQMRAHVEAHSWRLAAEGWFRAVLRRPHYRGGLWEQPEVPARLDAWAAGIHERLAAAERERGIG